MNKIFPDNIKHIAVIAPAGPTPPDRVEPALRLLQSQGVKVTVMPHVFEQRSFSYLSSSVKNRVQDLHDCLQDTSIDLIHCVRGGFGTAQILPEIDWDLMRSRSLPLLGYSDITALHLAMLRYRAGMPIAAPMVAKLPQAMLKNPEKDYTRCYFHAALTLEHPPLEIIPPPGAQNFEIIKKGSATGLPVVGNLAVMASLCGTSFMPDFSDKVLILEDINEPVYKLDRYFTQLEQCGILRQCAGVLFGSFLYCENETEQRSLFERIAAVVNGPVIVNFPFGHDFPLASINQTKMLEITEQGFIFQL